MIEARDAIKHYRIRSVRRSIAIMAGVLKELSALLENQPMKPHQA
jgi:hypothetical protein